MTVWFFVAPAGIFDFASFSFQVPISGLWARLTPTLKSIVTKTNAVLFIWSPLEKWLVAFILGPGAELCNEMWNEMWNVVTNVCELRLRRFRAKSQITQKRT